MKLRHYILVFTVAFVGSIFLASCLNDENLIPPNCFDGILNNGENSTNIINPATNQPFADCGGPCEEPCNHCLDGILNEGETWRDCGGECLPCILCNNGILDIANGENGIDCGGANCGQCSDLCEDGLLNGLETSVDCGSIYCDPCPSCSDLIINQGETGIDCGNGICDPCASEAICDNINWEASSELLQDCGGPDCYACDTIFKWKIDDIEYYCLPSSITFTATATSIDIVGTDFITGSILNISISTIGTFQGVQTVVVTLSDFPDAVIFNDGTPPLFSTGYANAEFTFNIDEYQLNWTDWAGLTQTSGYKGTFTGTLLTAGGIETIITDGQFQIAW